MRARKKANELKHATMRSKRSSTVRHDQRQTITAMTEVLRKCIDVVTKKTESANDDKKLQNGDTILTTAISVKMIVMIMTSGARKFEDS